MAGHKYQEPFMQAAHAAWSLGATIEPFIMQPFLRENTSDSNRTKSVIHNNVSVNAFQGLNVKHGFLITGAIITLVSFLTFFILWCIGPKFCRHDTHPKKKGVKNRADESKDKLDHVFFIGCLAILAFWFFTQVWIEVGLGSFVAIFAVKGLGWSKGEGSWVTSALWGSQCVGRVLSIPVAAFLAPRTMVLISVVGTASSAVILLCLLKVSYVFYWISVTLAGFTMSSAFGSMVLWASRHIPVTGVAASVFVAGSSIGGLVGPVVIGQLFEFSPMNMVYVTLAASLFQVLGVLLFELFTRFYSKDKQIWYDESTHNIGESLT